MKTARLSLVNVYALRHRGKQVHPACGDQLPRATPGNPWRRAGCRLPAYHAGLHRLKDLVWSSGDLAAHVARGRKPSRGNLARRRCSAVPGDYCKRHRVRHYRPRGGS